MTPLSNLRWAQTVAGLLVCWVSTSAVGQALPPAAIRQSVEEVAVLVRVHNADLNQTEQYGTGLVVNVGKDQVRLITAAHVVDAADDRDEASVEVKFFGRNAWVEASRVPLEPVAADQDVAVLEISKQFALFAADFEGPSLAIQTAPDPGSRVWALGVDRDLERLRWVSCFVNRAVDGLVIIDGKGIAPGFSGGILASSTGLIGMVQEEGNRGRGHKCLGYGKIGVILDSQTVKHFFARDPFIEALRYATDTRLTAALFVIDYRDPRDPQGISFWAGLRFDPEWTDVPKAVIYTGREQAQPTSVQFQSSAEGLSMAISNLLQWSFSRNKLPNLGTQELSLKVDADIQIKGFVVLSEEFVDRHVYLALPIAAREMLVSRVICDNVPPGRAYAVVPPDIKLVSKDDLRVRRSPVPFSVLLHRNASRIEVAPPEWLTRDEAFQISGKTLVTDEAASNFKEGFGSAEVAAITIGIAGKNHAAGEVIGRANFGLPDTGFEFQIPAEHPPSMILEADLPRVYNKHGGFPGLGFTNLVIEYSSLKE